MELKFFIDDFFLKNLEILNFFKELKILNFFFFFWKKPKKYKPNAPSPKAFFENCLFWKLSFFFWRFVHYQKSEEDEDEDGVKVIKIIYSWFFLFFWEKPILWMRITLAGSWCELLDKSLLNSCKKIISISNGFIHWNELEVLTQCP